MTSTVRNLIIGAVVAIVVAAGAAIAFSGGDDNDAGKTDVAVSAVPGDDGTGGGGSDGSSGGSGGGQGGGQGQGDQSGGDQGQGDQSGGDAGDEAAPPDAEQATSAPTVNLIDQHCNAQKLLVTITANASSGYRKGVKSVTTSRKNDENADLSFNAQWLGPETGAGDQWTATLNYGNNFGKTLRVVATSDSNQSTTKEYQITVPC